MKNNLTFHELYFHIGDEIGKVQRRAWAASRPMTAEEAGGAEALQALHRWIHQRLEEDAARAVAVQTTR